MASAWCQAGEIMLQLNLVPDSYFTPGETFPWLLSNNE